MEGIALERFGEGATLFSYRKGRNCGWKKLKKDLVLGWTGRRFRPKPQRRVITIHWITGGGVRRKERR